MPTKRTYMQTGTPAKRTKTLTQEVAKLKKQVTQNKHEVKYFDDIVTFVDDSRSGYNSFIVKKQSAALPTLPRTQFYGRKLYVHKIEYRYELTSPNERMNILRHKKAYKFPESSTMPLMIDPEYHTILRFSEGEMDLQKQVYHGTIDFKGSPRLVEFDSPIDQSDGETTIPITKGDITIRPSVVGRFVQYRLWYHDG
ncbi:MAG: hypothetical protein [Circular genetic element sp.]|nr:MAG: hypothetical protein [Circular genetic element sp.]